MKMYQFYAMMLLGAMLCGGCTPSSGSNNDAESCAVAEEQHPVVPENWATYTYKGRFRFSVPPTVEIKSQDDPMQKMMRGYDIPDIDGDQLVFQFKGRSNELSDLDKHYCSIRASISLEEGTLRYNEIEPLTPDVKEAFLQSLYEGMAQTANFAQGINYFSQDTKDLFKKVGLLEEPTLRWITIRDFKALELSYRRSSLRKTTTRVITYILFNTKEVANLTVAYREQEADLWQEDFEYIIQTFEWINKY